MDWLKRLFRQEEEMEISEETHVEEVYPSKKPPFRFPLISDEEKAYLLHQSPEAVKQTYIEPKPKKTTEFKAEKIHNSGYAARTPIQSFETTRSEPVQPDAPKKRYVPTVVPSPVFGLKNEAETTSGITRTMRTSHYDWTTQEEVEYEDEVAMTTATELEKQDVVEETVEIEPVQIQENHPMFAEPEAPKEKIKPFNVLMLSTDKKKLEQNKDPVISQVREVQIVQQVQTVAESIETETVSELQTPIPSYAMPNSSFLQTPAHQQDDQEWMDQQAEHLVETLAHFQIQADVISIVQGPAVTQFELTVGQGTKVSKIRNLTDDLKLALAAKDIRIQAPIPGRRSIGIEIPNRSSRAVQLAEVIESAAFKQAESPLEVAMGLDLHGQPVTMDLRKMPHGLIAGATGSGKSVFINSLLISLLYKASPSDVKLLLIDPKMVELAPFNHIPHLISPVITDVKAASAALKWAVEEMERRYQLFAHTGVRDITRYNHMALQAGEFNKKLPFIVIVIDELADMMMAAPQDVEDAICRIAQKARACGIHLVLATQRPSVDVITGLIKSNVPTRIAFAVSSQIDSRTILDQQGAERLLGKGDMLYLGSGMASPIRIQGTYVSDEEIDRIIDHARAQGEPDYFFKQEDLIVRAIEVEEQDELFEEACRFVIEHGAASTSLLQRKFHLGYNRAARLMDSMEQAGIITSQNGSKPRDILVTEEFLQEIL